MVTPGLPQFFPEANPFNLISNFTFGGTNALPSTRAIGGFEQRYPFDARNPTWNMTTSLTKQRGSHNLKAGIFIERVMRPARRQSNFNGDLQLLGERQPIRSTRITASRMRCSARSTRTRSRPHGPSPKAGSTRSSSSAQDNWRLSRKLTLDLGVRFVHIGATYVADQQIAYFDPARGIPANAPKLFSPSARAPRRRARWHPPGA